MKNVSNRECVACVEACEEFMGSNLQGIIEGSFYVVYSWGWYPLIAYDMENGGWYENGDKFSSSTSKHLSQARPRVNTIVMSYKAMKEMLAGLVAV